MEKLIDQISARLAAAFEAAGYDPSYGRAAVSNRPDLCEYQCNGALAAAKVYHKAPLAIANEVAAQLDGNAVFHPGRGRGPRLPEPAPVAGLPLHLAGADAGRRPSGRRAAEPAPDHRRGLRRSQRGQAAARGSPAPGHHRREPSSRMDRYLGNEVIGDVHLGDWGLQMGLIIEERARPRSRSCPILTRTSPANTLPRPPSPSPTWRRFTPRPAPGARRTRPSPPGAHDGHPPACSRASAATAPCSGRLCASPWPT